MPFWVELDVSSQVTIGCMMGNQEEIKTRVVHKKNNSLGL